MLTLLQAHDGFWPVALSKLQHPHLDQLLLMGLFIFLLSLVVISSWRIEFDINLMSIDN